MNSRQLTSYLRCNVSTSPFFRGVFAVDEVLAALRGDRTKVDEEDRARFYIVNTDVATKRGRHWILLFVNPRTRCIYFLDSYAQNPSEYGVIMKDVATTMRDQHPMYTYFELPFCIQSNVSALCGLYCIYFAYQLCRNVSFNDMCAQFSPSDRRNNDKKLLHWYRKQHIHFHSRAIITSRANPIVKYQCCCPRCHY